jgi:hypothetical protein
VPPVGYYDPSYAMVHATLPRATWSKRERQSLKTRSLDEGAMKLGSVQKYAITRILPFEKQLPRQESSRQAGNPSLRTDYAHGSSLTERVNVPDMSKTLGRPEGFPGAFNVNPDYRPNFSLVWKPLVRNLSFKRTSGRTAPKTTLQDLVYDHISYAQIRPSVPSPTLKCPKGEIQSSPLPRFMRNLTSWQSISGANGKAQIQTNSERTKRKNLHRNFNSLCCGQETSASPEKRSEGGRDGALTGRSSSLIFSSI